jgi:hypothetical protein
VNSSATASKACPTTDETLEPPPLADAKLEELPPVVACGANCAGVYVGKLETPPLVAGDAAGAGEGDECTAEGKFELETLPPVAVDAIGPWAGPDCGAACADPEEKLG